jgi:hypothetical protein
MALAPTTAVNPIGWYLTSVSSGNPFAFNLEEFWIRAKSPMHSATLD